MSGFQASVKNTPAPAVNGDFASANPRSSCVAPESGFVAGATCVVGRFGWIGSDGVTVQSTGSGKPDGFIHREQQALITAFLGESSNSIPAGLPVTLMRTGDYFATSTVAAATKGNKAFAKLADGTMEPAAAGATVSGFIETDFVCVRTVAAINDLTVISL